MPWHSSTSNNSNKVQGSAILTMHTDRKTCIESMQPFQLVYITRTRNSDRRRTIYKYIVCTETSRPHINFDISATAAGGQALTRCHNITELCFYLVFILPCHNISCLDLCSYTVITEHHQNGCQIADSSNAWSSSTILDHSDRKLTLILPYTDTGTVLRQDRERQTLRICWPFLNFYRASGGI